MVDDDERDDEMATEPRATADNGKFGDRLAYAPADITESWRDPVAVWRQFCRQARLTHAGKMQRPFVQLRMDL